jgi:hypothetical protein
MKNEKNINMKKDVKEKIIVRKLLIVLMYNVICIFYINNRRGWLSAP